MAAQLPTLIRGLFFEGWKPAKVPVKMTRQEFLERVRREFPFEVEGGVELLVERVNGCSVLRLPLRTWGSVWYKNICSVLGGGGLTAPDQRIEATLRAAPGGPVERATYPPGTAHRNRWPVRHRGGRMRRRTLTGDRTTSGFQVRKTGRRAGECLSQVPLH